MVARDDVLGDLLHVLHGTQWPPDPTDSSRRKTPPPKPARTPQPAPIRRAPSSSGGASRPDLPAFVSSFLPDELSLDVRAQYDQVNPDPTPVLTFDGHPFSTPPTPHRRDPAFSSLGRPTPGAAAEGEPSSPAGVGPLPTPTQRHLLQLLARLYAVEPPELRRLEEATCLRQKACVTLTVSLEMSGEPPPTLKGDLRLLRTSHARILTAPLPPTYSTSMAVDNLWSQQLLVRFSRERPGAAEDSRTLRRLRHKKTPKHKLSVPTSGEASQPSPAPSLDVPALLPPDDTASVTKSPLGFDERTAATLQRGLKGIRSSFKKKKNKIMAKDGANEGTRSIPSSPLETQSPAFEEKTSASPFLRFRSLRVKKSDSLALERINKFRASFSKGRWHQQQQQRVVSNQQTPPLVVKKEELLTKSEPPRKTFKVNNTFEMVDLIEEENLDSTNPFARQISRPDKLEDNNPFSPDYLAPTTPSQVSTGSNKKAKSFRRSIRKTLRRMSGMKKKKNKEEPAKDDQEHLSLHKTVSRQLFKEEASEISKEDLGKTDLSPTDEVQGKKEAPAHEPSSISEENYEELKCRILNLRDVCSQAEYSEQLELLPALHVKLSLQLDIDFKTNCRVFELYKSTFSALYKERFIELLPQKSELEGVDCNATVEGETLLKQVVTFCGLEPEKVALARFLVLVEAATGKMGTPNSLSARRMCQQKSSSCLSSAAGTASTSTSELDAGARGDEEGDLQEAQQEFVYNQKSETILVNPGDITRLLEKVRSGLSEDLFTVSEKNSAVQSAVALCRWVIGHHIERLQTVFPISGAPTTSDNLAHTLKCLKAVEEDPILSEGYASDVAELGLDGIRSNLALAVRKYTELWVAALIRETTHRIDTAMTDAAPAVAVTQSSTSPSLSVPQQEDRSQTPLTLDVPTMVEAMPALLTNFVRSVRQFENNKQIVYLAELVEKRLGTYRPLNNAIGTTVPTPMLTYQRDEQAPPDEDEVAEMVLRLNVVGLLMPVIVDYLDVAKHFYDPIFKENFGLAFLDECWAALVGGTLSLYRQIGARDVLRVSLVDPPLKPDMLPQAIGAVWALCESFSSINKLGGSARVQKCDELISCMEDCVMCWLLLIAQRATLQLEKDLKRMSAGNLELGLQELENDMIDFIKLVVDKTERLVWAEGQCPREMLRFLGSHLAYQLNSFWLSLYNDYTGAQDSPNIISKWACEVMSCLCVLRDELSAALRRLDPDKTAMQEAHNSLQLMPQKAAQKMCYQEVRSLEEWVGQAAGGGGGGALVHKLDEVLQHVYHQLGPCQPLVSILRDRVLDATQGHLDTITQEEEFIQLAAVLQALQQFFTSNILLEESLQQAEERWEEQLSLARERGLPLAELQQRYYARRLQEQGEQLVEDQTSSSMLLVNIVFVEGLGLSVSMVQAPSAACLARAAVKSPSSLHNNNNNNVDSSPHLNGDPRAARSQRTTPSGKTSGIISNMFKGVSSTGGVYVKAQLVPSEWFPDAPAERKTSVCKDDPAVFDEELSFPTVQHSHSGVQKGGFLLLRLKLTRRMRSQVVSEALVALNDLPVLTLENRRSKPHTHLILTRAAPLHTYEPLNILRRRNDDVTRQFLQQLEHDNKGHAKADLGGSNISISSMW